MTKQKEAETIMLSPNAPYPHPGKYEGERMLVPVLWERYEPNDSFGDASEWGAFCARYDDVGMAGTVYLLSDDQGFVGEITRSRYEALLERYIADGEATEALEEARAELDEAQAQENGPCDACAAAMINGVRCHEHGCRRYARLQELVRRVEALEEA